MEKEVSGLYLSGHPLNGYKAVIDRLGSCTIHQITGENAKELDGRVVNVICAVVKVKFLTTKSNSTMAFVTVEDLTGTMEVLLFPKVLAGGGSAVRENAVVLIRGRVSVKEDEPAKLVADEVLDVAHITPDQMDAIYVPGKQALRRPAAAQPAAKPAGKYAGLWLRLPSRNCPQMRAVENLLAIFDGSEPVYFVFEDTGVRAAAPRSMWCQATPRLISELQLVLGAKNVAKKT